MQKEILTAADCKARLLKENNVSDQRSCRAVLYWLLFTLTVSAIFAMIIWLPLVAISGKIPSWVYVLPTVLSLFPPTVLLSVFFFGRSKANRLYRLIQQNGIEILEDTLKSAYEDGRSRGRHYDLFYVLTFQNSGSYEVPERQHYEWSELYSMSHRGVYNTSIAGDTFYIVRLKDDPKRRILEVYNTKLFELCPDGTEKKSRSSWRDSINVE